MCFYHTDEAAKGQNCPDFCLALDASLALGLQAGRADEVDSKLMRIVIELLQIGRMTARGHGC